MKALILKEYNQLVYEDVPMPQPGHGDVLVQVKACGPAYCEGGAGACAIAGASRPAKAGIFGCWKAPVATTTRPVSRR